MIDYLSFVRYSIPPKKSNVPSTYVIGNGMGIRGISGEFEKYSYKKRTIPANDGIALYIIGIFHLLKFIFVKIKNHYPAKSFTKHLNHMGRHLFNLKFIFVNTFRDASRYLSIGGVM